MRIGIDCRLIGPEQGGLGRYLEQLLSHLAKLDETNEYVLFLRNQNLPIKLPSNFKYKKVVATIPWYGWREQIVFKGIIKREKIELMHFPHWNVPVFYNQPFVVTIHDLLLLEYPTRAASTLGPVTYWFKNLAYRLVLRHAAKASKHILTTSEFTKLDLIKKLSLPAEKITVTYQAAVLPEQKNDSDQNKWGITKPYLLYVGVAYPHKNLDRLLEAWPKIQSRTKQAYQLVLTGKINFFYQKLQTKAKNLGLTDVIFTDFVPDTDLPGLYTKARLFVYPSLYEGFGLPPLEAWQKNIPVVASNRASLPEVLGTGALYFDPESADQMATVITTGLTDDLTRGEIKANAKAEITRFSWEKCAQATLSVYEANRTQAK